MEDHAERINRIEAEVKSLAEIVHRTRREMTQLLSENRQQTDMLRDVHKEVLGPEGLGEIVRNHEREILSVKDQKKETRTFLFKILAPVLVTIALAMLYTTFRTQDRFTGEDARQLRTQIQQLEKVIQK
jgi:hypothetical protein